MGKYTYEDVVENFKNRGFKLLTGEEAYTDLKHKVVISNGIYKAYVKPEDYIYRTKEITPYWFGRNNPFILDNIKNYLYYEKDDNFILLSEEYTDRDSLLKFKCKRCEHIFDLSWFNAYRKDNNHKGISCEYCDSSIESTHAFVLKQMFMHYYPSSIVEEKSCRNPITNAIMPTDIVNHDLKIAIEIQGQFHERKEQKIRDKIKKDYWINKGYQFYDYKIDNISVLEYVQLFFSNIQEIPDWIDYNFSKKLNLKIVQDLLNNNMKILDIASQLNVSEHRIYDALGCNKLYYPKGYKKNNDVSVVQLNLNKEYVDTYKSYREAERKINISKGLIASAIFDKRYYAKGYYWIPEYLYMSGKYIIPQRRDEKFEIPVAQYDLNGKYIQTFDTIKDAAKNIEVIPYKIYEIVIGKRKTIKGFTYKAFD